MKNIQVVSVRVGDILWTMILTYYIFLWTISSRANINSNREGLFKDILQKIMENSFGIYYHTVLLSVGLRVKISR